MRPAVSVLLPVYNGETYLAEAIESILNQEFRDFELLVLDDGSTDQSMDIVRSFTDGRIRLIRSNRNNGLVATLNLGIELSQGAFIARMDADDVSLPHRLGLQHDYLNRHPDIAMCGGAVKVMGTEEMWIQPQDPEEVKCSLLFRCCIAHPTVMIRRESLTTTGMFYDPRFKHAEDYELWVRLSRRTLITNLRIPLIRYRLHNNQVSRVHSTAQINRTREIHRRQLEELGLNPTESQLDIHFDPYKNCGTPELQNWFYLLLDANRKHPIYRQSVFENVLQRFCQGG